ncbi:MAG: isochorismate synthase [Sterolibacteriaceae bacterium MAG5]|nr:isochorismate synthase [Candidatus Nitricoxidireducens bremensis]
MSVTLPDWAEVGRRLARLAAPSHPARLLSITVDLPDAPRFGIPEAGDWCVWRRPDRELKLFGSGRVFAASTSGTGRFAVLHAAHGGLLADWRHEGGPPPVAFLGFAYSPRGGGPLSNACLWVPELLVREARGSVSVTFSCAAAEAPGALARWRGLWQRLAELPPASAVAPRFEQCANPLADRAFLARGRAALRAIGAGGVDKLVLTRSVRLRAEHPFAAASVLDALSDRHAGCATFGVGRGGRAFVGASPETLLRVDGSRVEADALAGTAWLADAGTDPATPATLSLGGDKNRREHDFVARAVAEALASLCDGVETPEAPEVLRFNTLQHLCRRVTARRPTNVSAIDLVARLHPTPAVGGAPTAAALDWLAAHGDRRGAWYTGGIGWVDAAGDADIAVALRCGLLHGRDATLFAGAGFVAGSVPEQELAETEAKFSVMRAALAADGVAVADGREEAA